MFRAITEFFRRFYISGQNILHVGAHLGEEDPIYTEFNMDPIYIEADKYLFEKISSQFPNRKKHNIAVSNKKKKKIPFHIANNQRMSSSLLDMGPNHENTWGGVRYTSTIEVNSTTIDDLIEENNYDIDALFLDIQGGEMNALLGAKKTLEKIDFIIMEIHLIQLYEDESLLPNFDKFLDKFDFKRVIVEMTHEIEGDALYIKRNFLRDIRKRPYFYPDPSKIIQLSDLGTFIGGRFGNQLLQYAIGKGYCNTYGYTLEIPGDWIGCKIFKNIDDNIIKEELPENRVRNRCQNGEYNINIQTSWSMCQDSISFFTKREVRKWFELKNEYKIKPDRTKKIVAHLRRGDYLQEKYIKRFSVIARKCYKKAIEKFGYNYNDVYFVQEPFFHSYAYNAWIDNNELSFLEDFQIIQNAEVIFRSNSTFSWWAAALSDAKVFSPVVGRTIGWQDKIQFVEGNHPSIAYKKNFNHEQWFTDMHLYQYE